MNLSANIDTNPPGGWILGVDTSVPGGEVSLFSPSRNLLRQKNLPIGIRTSRVILPTIHTLLDETNIGKNAILAVGVALGPGSFTGLRIGLATAKGLAFGLRRPLYGISSLDALANTALTRSRENNLSPPSWILTYRDARHGEIFSALFGQFSSESQPVPTCPRTGKDQVSPPERVQMPETGTVLLAGRKMDLPPAWSDDSLGPRFPKMDIPSASGGVARLTWEAIRRGEPPAAPDVQPIYGRKPRAETQWAPPGP